MTTTADEAAFLTAIATNPEDDTVRLVYADWLEENPLPEVVCGKCEGKGGFSTPDYDGGMCDRFWDRCMTCHGTGTIRDTSRRDRAEFIRVQCELAMPRWEITHDIEVKQRRADELEKRYRDEWAKCPCPVCGGCVAADCGLYASGWCDACGGTGDLLLRHEGWVSSTDQAMSSRNPTFRRGFIDSVECLLEEVVMEVEREFTNGADFPPRLAPTPWARAIVTTLPVTRLRIADREPYLSRYSTSSYYGWQNADATTRRDRECLPKWIFDMLGGFCEVACPPYLAKWYSTRDAALDALAVAACRVVRRAVYGS